MTQSLLTIVCSPALEDPLADWMLAYKDMPGFTSVDIHGHSTDKKNLTLQEQVKGRRQQVMFQVHMDSELAEAVIRDLQLDFEGARIHYWLTPVISSGNLTKAPSAGE